MSYYSDFKELVSENFIVTRILKESERGRVCLVRHKTAGGFFVLREYTGDGSAYLKLTGIKSPFLPEVLETAVDKDQVIVLEEYVSGDNMADMLKGCLFTEKETKQLSSDICKALYALHSCGIVHRDVKPENIIIRGKTAVLTDFDASRIFKNDRTNDTVILGTTGYAAPEQYGISQTDARADIYSLGILMNIMLTGEHPSVRLAKGKFGRLIRKCTVVSPSHRYPDILHVLEALR